jgi:outer membrane lipoprotein-sorting protein
MKQVTIAAAVIAALLTAPAGSAAPAQQPSAKEIMERNFFVSKVSSLRIESTMVLVNARGQERIRRNTAMFKLQPNGIDSKIVIQFSAPADITGTAVLQVEHADGEDDLWIYLPALKKSRRLVANNKKDSFAGSDFSYGDITLPKIDLYRHSLLRTEKVDGADCYVVESVPVTDAIKSNTGYSRKVTWVRTDSFMESKVDYYDVAGRLLKTQTTGRHQLIEPAKGRWFALSREMTNHQTGHRTKIEAAKAEAVPISDDTFTTRFLER